MISINRTLTLEEYVAANRLAYKHSSLWRRMNLYGGLYVMPVIGAVLTIECVLLVLISRSVHAFEVFSFPLGLYFCLWPLLYHRKLKRCYLNQNLDKEWSVELSDTGVRSVLSGQFDAVLNWQFFRCSEETDKLICLINTKHLSFISIPKHLLSEEQLEEIRLLAAKHLTPAQ